MSQRVDGPRSPSPRVLSRSWVGYSPPPVIAPDASPEIPCRKCIITMALVDQTKSYFSDLSSIFWVLESMPVQTARCASAAQIPGKRMHPKAASTPGRPCQNVRERPRQKRQRLSSRAHGACFARISSFRRGRNRKAGGGQVCSTWAPQAMASPIPSILLIPEFCRFPRCRLKRIRTIQNPKFKSKIKKIVQGDKASVGLLYFCDRPSCQVENKRPFSC